MSQPPSQMYPSIAFTVFAWNLSFPVYVVLEWRLLLMTAQTGNFVIPVDSGALVVIVPPYTIENSNGYRNNML